MLSFFRVDILVSLCMNSEIFSDIGTINNIKFTTREIDVVSCLMNGRSSKFISQILSISPKTVEAHIRNIKLKIECSSKEQLLDFFEKSNKKPFISSRYNFIVVEHEFSDLVKKMSMSCREFIDEKILIVCVFSEFECKRSCKIIENLHSFTNNIDVIHFPLNNIDIDLLQTKSKDFFKTIVIGENEQFVENYMDYFSKIPNLTTFFSMYHYNEDNREYYKKFINLIKNIYGRESSYKEHVSKFLDFCEGKSLEKIHHHNDFEENGIMDDMSSNINNIILKNKKISYLIFGGVIFFLGGIISLVSHHYENHEKNLILFDIPTIKEGVFLERPCFIKKLDEIFENQKGIKIAVITGQGGAGKTVLSREYLKKQKDTFVWEINAENNTSIVNSIIELSYILASTKSQKDELKFITAIRDNSEREKKILFFLQNLLRNVGDWCIAFDDVESLKSIDRYIPNNHKIAGNGKIIITTRNANIKNGPRINPDCVIDIASLRTDEQLSLFCKILYNKKMSDIGKENIEKIKKFLKSITPLPLDVSAAAYYIKNSGVNLDQYSDIIEKMSLKFDKMQHSILSETGTYTKTRCGIVSSTFNSILKTNDDFKVLLLMSCLVNPSAIQRDLLELCCDKVVVNDFIYNLKKHSFISDKGSCFSMHRSAQSIGLGYIVGEMDRKELDRLIKIVIDVLTPYSAIDSILYKSSPFQMGEKQLNTLLPHLESVTDNLSKLNLTEEKIEEYRAKLLLAIALKHVSQKNYALSCHFLNSIVNIQERIHCLRDYEYCVALLELGYSYLIQNDLVSAENFIKKSLELSRSVKDSEIIRACNLANLGVLYHRKNNFVKNISLLEEAISIVSNSGNEPWVDNVAVLIHSFLSNAYIDNFINKPDMKRAIDYSYEALKKMGIPSNFISLQKKVVVKNVDLAIKLCWSLARAYNMYSQYEKALGIEYYSYFICSSDPNGEHVRERILIDSEYGYTLLRKGDIEKAECILDRAVSLKRKLNDDKDLLFMMSSRIEARMRLGKLDDAYNDCIYVMNMKDKDGANYSRLFANICVYHAAIIKYKQGDLDSSLRYFADFFKDMEEFCQDFLDIKTFAHLKSMQIFNVIPTETQLRRYLLNSVEILVAIFGRSHSFITDYVQKNV